MYSIDPKKRRPAGGFDKHLVPETHRAAVDRRHKRAGEEATLATVAILTQRDVSENESSLPSAKTTVRSSPRHCLKSPGTGAEPVPVALSDSRSGSTSRSSVAG